MVEPPPFKSFAGPFALAGVVAVVVSVIGALVSMTAPPADRIGWPMILAAAAFAAFTPIGILLLRDSRFFLVLCLTPIPISLLYVVYMAIGLLELRVHHPDEVFRARSSASGHFHVEILEAVPAVAVGLAVVGWHRHIRGI